MILDLLQKQGSVQVLELGQALGVSEVTIRRDLELMEQERLLERTHGGALQSRRMLSEPAYLTKYGNRSDQKAAIGAAAAALIEPGETIFIHSGSTNLQIFQHLNQKNVRIVTSNAGAFTNYQDFGGELIVAGGNYRQQSHSFVGPVAIDAIRNFYASKCFIGVDGVSLQYGLPTPSVEEAEIARAMIEHTHGKTIVVADSSKFGVVAATMTAPIERMDILVVDAGLDEGCRFDLKDLGIQVVVAG